MYNIREYVVGGALISYAPSRTEVYRQMGTYVARGFERGKVVEDYFSFEFASRAKRNALKRYIFLRRPHAVHIPASRRYLFPFHAADCVQKQFQRVRAA